MEVSVVRESYEKQRRKFRLFFIEGNVLEQAFPLIAVASSRATSGDRVSSCIEQTYTSVVAIVILVVLVLFLSKGPFSQKRE